MEMKEYEQPVLEVVKFNSEDVVVNLASSDVMPLTTGDWDFPGYSE